MSEGGRRIRRERKQIVVERVRQRKEATEKEMQGDRKR